MQYTQNGKYGVLNEKGEMIVPSIYQDIHIPNPTKAVFICKKEDGNYETLNEAGEKIFEKYYNVQGIEIDGGNSTCPYEKSVLKYEENGKYGLIDFNGKPITKAIYEEISSVKYKEGEILVKKKGKYGVVNIKGKKLIPCEYDGIEADKYYHDGYSKTGYITRCETNDGKKYGYINSNWKKMLKTEYVEINRILDIDSEDVYLIVSKNGQYGLIKNKEKQIDFSYQALLYNKGTNLLSAERNEKFGVITLSGENIIPIQYKGIRFNGIYISAKSYEEEEYFDTKGEKVNSEFTGMKEIEGQNCYITTDKNNLYGIIDKKRQYTRTK